MQLMAISDQLYIRLYITAYLHPRDNRPQPCGVLLLPIPLHFEHIAEHGIPACLHPQIVLVHPALQRVNL